MSDWLAKAAIIWTNEFVSTQSCPYWDHELLALLSSLDDECHPDVECSISYGSLLVAAMSIVDSLRQLIHVILAAADPPPSDLLGVSIVVAVPEGPLLPLAILVVHLLNEPIRLEDAKGGVLFAMLVPLEPGEGKERLRHMLVDARPTVILASPGKDAERLQEILASIKPVETSVTAEGLYRPCRSVLIDFFLLVRDAINTKEDIRSLSQRIRGRFSGMNEQESLLQPMSLFDEMTRGNEHSMTDPNRISHIVYTSGTTGTPKGCISSIRSLRHYLTVKNGAHHITSDSIVLLASALSFDPCLSDILATFEARATLVIAPRTALIQDLSTVMQRSHVTHVLCTSTLWEMVHIAGVRPNDFPSLQVVVLGGEPIPKHILKTWARGKATGFAEQAKLCATYGVTEACVYQTFGEVWRDDEGDGQNVGTPLHGLHVRICDENDQRTLRDFEDAKGSETCLHAGEVVLFGMQIDKYSAYLNMKQLSREKFVEDLSPERIGGELSTAHSLYFYRTGDRGRVDPITGEVRILGRIHGEDGMVKVNGVRVELGEIEGALIDDNVVIGCLAVDRKLDNGSKQIHAFCVLSRPCLQEIGIQSTNALGSGVLLTTGPLLLLLRARCMEHVRAGAIPAIFAIIERLPLSPTGKRDRRRLPLLSDCISLDSLKDGSDGTKKPLWEHGTSGAVVAKHVIDCLNLQPCQRPLLTTSTSFVLLGGDSLAATRVARSLYAYHHNVFNTRFLGGAYGVLEAPFTASHLLRVRTMGDYVDLLDSHGVCCSSKDTREQDPAGANNRKATILGENDTVLHGEEKDFDLSLYEALLEAATSGQSVIAIALLDHGVDPNLGDHGGRLSRVSDRTERKRKFRSNPLHLACSKGSPELVKKLLEKGCRFNSPDATGSFPIHLAASGMHMNQLNTVENKDQDRRRCECARSLLDAGAPLSMKDGNKQTVLHCAARAGHCELLRYLMQCWRSACDGKKINFYEMKHKGGRFDWTDRWFRTPVHWAVINGKVEALRILLDGGCSSNPPKPKSNRQTSVAIESPNEICDRLYGDSETGKLIQQLLLEASSKSY
jgi:acyl-CoA synthetase (AMP-forming)/AMP-acid ligase II/ankyrin repeat protein